MHCSHQGDLHHGQWQQSEASMRQRVAEVKLLVNVTLEVRKKLMSDMVAIPSTGRESRRQPAVHPLHVESCDRVQKSCSI